jgi:hypothetical protein
MGGSFLQQGGWAQQQQQAPQPLIQTHARNKSHRQPFAAPTDRSYRSGNTSDRSESANEVETMLVNHSGNRTNGNAGWIPPPNAQPRQNQQGLLALVQKDALAYFLSKDLHNNPLDELLNLDQPPGCPWVDKVRFRLLSVRNRRHYFGLAIKYMMVLN